MAIVTPHELVGLREGELLAGKYRLENVLGVGGMGIVIAAHHIQLDEKFAIKFLRKEALGHAEIAARFAGEARAAARIKSEHVARVLDVGALPSGAPYMVMEHLDGFDLGALVEERGPLPVELAVEFVLQACVAVADAHALGIIHRDLKPANLFCVRRSDGQLSIKLLDFGISKVSDRALGSGADSPRYTQPTGQMGSPVYMSPEQMRCAPDIDTRTDIWSLGIILFELLTADAPFPAQSVTELAIEVATAATPSVRVHRPDVSEALDAVVTKCLEKQRVHRYASVQELALALLPFAPARAAPLVERVAGIGAALSGAASDASELGILAAALTASAAPGMARMATTARATPARSRLGRSALATLCALSLMVLVGSIWRRAARAGREPAHVVSAPPPPALPAAPASAAAATTTAEPPQLDPSPPTIVPPPSEPERSAARAHSRSAPAALPARRARTSAKPPARKLSCDPPFYFDAHGNRLFKKECV